jgi:hypothetical protein
MAKKISIEKKRNWLEVFENGETVISLANSNNCDSRTVQRALDDARRERDARYARSELMKEALRNHQEKLKEELNNVLSNLAVPNVDFVPLSWSQDEKSIFSPFDDKASFKYLIGAARRAGKPRETITTYMDTLRQHLRNENVWKSLELCDKAHAQHMADREVFQRKVKQVLENTTGLAFSDKDIKPKRFLYSYIAGWLTYRFALGDLLEGRNIDDFKRDIKIETKDGTVKYQNSTMAEASGHEVKCRRDIIKAIDQLLESSEIKRVQASSLSYRQIYSKLGQKVNEILMLGYIPGNCHVCERLGM